MRLGVRIGTACRRLLDETIRGLTMPQVQVDEIWGFIGKKQRRSTVEDNEAGLGDVWTFVAIDPRTKLVPSYHIGRRDWQHTQQFMTDLASRVAGRVQISTDGMRQYEPAIEGVFGTEADHGQIVKVYKEEITGPRRYSPPVVTAIRKTAVTGHPIEALISTSHVERQNLTMRMHMRRLTRLTNAFSKKLENFHAAVALHFAYYNFVKVHSSIRMTPAMAAGISTRVWEVNDLVQLSN